MTRDGLPSGLPFATAGEPRMHMPAPATPQAPAPKMPVQDMQVQDVQVQDVQVRDVQVRDTQAQDTAHPVQGMPAAAAPAPRSLADFALVGQAKDSGGADRASSIGATDMPRATGTADISGAPVLRILYNASTKGTLHPCPS